MKRVTFILIFITLACVLFAQTERAIAMYEEATSGKVSTEQFLKQDFAEVDSTSMHDLAVLFYRANDYVSAGVCWEVALGKVEKYGKAYEKILKNLEAVYIENASPEKIQWFMQVVDDFNKHELLKDCNDYKCKLERAQYYVTQGDEVKAIAHIKESLELCETDEQRVEVEEAYASILFDIRDYEGAAQYYYSAANRWKGLGKIERYSDAMYWAAQNYIISSKFDMAEKCARQSTEVFRDNKTENGRKKYILQLVCLGDALFCQQKYSEALEIYKEELEICKVIMPDSEKHADAIEDIGKVQARLKQYEEAIASLQQACDMYKSLNLNAKYSNTYSELLVCMRKAGDNDAAESMEQEADNKRKAVLKGLLESELNSLSTTEKYLGTMVYTNSLNTIAGCYYGLDQFTDAAHYFGLYTETLRKMLQEKFLLLTDVDRMRVWKDQQQRIDDYRFNVAALPDSVTNLMPLFIPTLYDMELISKGIMLNSVIEFEKVLHQMGDKELIEIYRKIKENQIQIESLQSELTDESFQKVLNLKRINTGLQLTLMTRSAAYRDYTKYLSYTWRDVQAKLDKDDVAIEFTTVPLSPLDKDNYILALILTSTGEPTMSVISTKAIIDMLKGKKDLYDNSQYYTLIWGLMKDHLVGKQRVYFAPDNNLSDIAIEYLNDGQQTFFEKYEVYRLSSTKELCRNYSETSDSKSMAIFGDIDYDTEIVAEKKSGISSYGKLRYSREEIDGIESSMDKNFELKIYDGKNATEKKFRELSDSGIKILHISSHGDYDGDDKISENDAMESSILAFSGANDVNSTDILDDGIISAADIAQMNLRKCDMAVLSACNTGIGGKGSDGIFGLQRGFKNAGVHSLLMSLKEVYDESTSKLMVAFYQGLAQGKTKRQSLLDAQKHIKSIGYTEGKDWAPFILLDALN